MQDLESNKPEPTESSEQLAVPLMQPSSPRRLTFAEIEQTAEMILGFREGVKEGTFKGKHLTHIAQGIFWLDTMVEQSKRDLNQARMQQEEMRKRAKEAIKAASGKIEMGVKGGETDSHPS